MFIILSLLICEHDMFLHLFRSSLISSIGILQFSVYKSYTYFVIVTSKYFSFFQLIHFKWYCGFNFGVHLWYLFVAYINTICFCVSCLYPMTLLNSLSCSFWQIPQIFLCKQSNHEKKKSFFCLFFFPLSIYMLFISISCLYALASISGTMLNE